MFVLANEIGRERESENKKTILMWYRFGTKTKLRANIAFTWPNFQKHFKTLNLIKCARSINCLLYLQNCRRFRTRYHIRAHTRTYACMQKNQHILLLHKTFEMVLLSVYWRTEKDKREMENGPFNFFALSINRLLTYTLIHSFKTNVLLSLPLKIKWAGKKV